MKELVSYKFLGCLLICILYLFKLNHWVVTSLSVLYSLLVLYMNSKKSLGVKESLLELIILTLPFSFIPLFEQLNFVSLFVILQLYIIIRYFKIGEKDLLSALILFLSFLINLVYLFKLGSSSVFAFEILIKINLFVFFSYVVLISFDISYSSLFRYKRLYVVSGLVSAITVILQYVFNKYLGITNLGTQSKFGEVRQGFTGLFFDYSIMSVYIASVAGLILFSVLSKKLFFKGYFFNFFLIIFFLGVSALTSARSGIFAFFVSIFLFLLWERRFLKLIYLSIISIPFIFLVLYIISLNRTSNLAADSGRFSNFQRALDFFYENPYVGSGGIGYNAITNNMLPHNFILDLLTDFGVFITSFVLILLLSIFKRGLKFNKDISFVLILFMIGGMFHASFVNTHYILFPVILIFGFKNLKNESTSSY